MSMLALSQYFGPYPPYYTRPNPEELSGILTASVPGINLTKMHEFSICAIVVTSARLYPQFSGAWGSFLPQIMAHWSALKSQVDRPGMNDYHIVAWSISGRKEHLEELAEAQKRNDARGYSAVWAINNLRRGSPDFDRDIRPILAGEIPGKIHS